MAIVRNTIPFQLGRLFGQSLEAESVVGPGLFYATKEDIPEGIRYEGMVTWVIPDQLAYRLVGGIADINWEEEGSNGIESMTLNNTTHELTIVTTDGNLTVDFSDILSIVSPITATGVGVVGGIADGDTVSTGTTLQNFVQQLLVKAIPATYTQSTAAISDNIANTIEVGQTFIPTLTITYNQNDSGAASVARFYRAGILINTDNSSPFQHIATAENFNAEGQTLTYTGQVDHAQGVQKFDNLGNPSGDPSVLVPARTGLSAGSTIFYGRRKIFYGVDNPAPVGVEDVRGFGNFQFATSNTFSINVSIGTVSVEFGIPSHKTLVSVTFVGALTNDETGNFLPTEQIISTNGAENRYPDNYKVYRYVPSVPFVSAVRYDIVVSG